jgi:hypothetical protein
MLANGRWDLIRRLKGLKLKQVSGGEKKQVLFFGDSNSK